MPLWLVLLVAVVEVGRVAVEEKSAFWRVLLEVLMLVFFKMFVRFRGYEPIVFRR